MFQLQIILHVYMFKNVHYTNVYHSLLLFHLCTWYHEPGCSSSSKFEDLNQLKVLAPSYDAIHFLPHLAFDIAWRHNQTGCRFNSGFFLQAGFESLFTDFLIFPDLYLYNCFRLHVLGVGGGIHACSNLINMARYPIFFFFFWC